MKNLAFVSPRHSTIHPIKYVILKKQGNEISIKKETTEREITFEKISEL